MEKLEKYCRVKFRILESDVVPAVDLVDPTARSEWAVGARGGVSRCSNHAEQIIASSVSFGSFSYAMVLLLSKSCSDFH